jgi:hypothetical protein
VSGLCTSFRDSGDFRTKVMRNYEVIFGVGSLPIVVRVHVQHPSMCLSYERRCLWKAVFLLLKINCYCLLKNNSWWIFVRLRNWTLTSVHNTLLLVMLYLNNQIVGKVNMELQLDATITVFIDLQDQLNVFRANICPSSGAQELVFYSIWYNVL